MWIGGQQLPGCAAGCEGSTSGFLSSIRMGGLGGRLGWVQRPTVPPPPPTGTSEEIKWQPGGITSSISSPPLASQAATDIGVQTPPTVQPAWRVCVCVCIRICVYVCVCLCLHVSDPQPSCFLKTTESGHPCSVFLVAFCCRGESSRSRGSRGEAAGSERPV